MINLEQIRSLALSFPETTEEPHFEKTSFRVRKKIFATYTAKRQQVTLKLTELDQDVFSAQDRSIVYPVPNKWGKQGWTIVELSKVHPDLFEDALTTAYCTVAPKKLAREVEDLRQDIRD